MEERLLPKRDSVVLKRASAPSVCAVREERIDKGEYVVMCKTTKYVDGTAWFHVSIPAVETLLSHLERIRFDTKQAIGQREMIQCLPGEYSGIVDYAECIVCCEDVSHESPHVESYRYAGTTWAFLHEECVDAFCEVLPRVWSHPEVLLPEQV